MINGIAVFIALCFLFLWLGSTWRKRLAGMGFFTDITIHILLQLFLGGANDGRLAVLLGGVMFNVTMLAYRKLRGYSTFTGGQWVNHSGLFYRVSKPRSDVGSGRAAEISS